MKSAKLLDELEQKLAERRVLKDAITDLNTVLDNLDTSDTSINLHCHNDNNANDLPELYDQLMFELNNVRKLAN